MSRTILGTLPHLSGQIDNIAGIASVNYRLSAYPTHPTDPSNQDDTARNARHPDHIEDVLTAVSWLQEKYHFKDRYILVGHSAGATLAFQAVMGVWSPRGPITQGVPTISLPQAVLGLEGIYDLEALLDSYSHVPFYRQFLEAAFGQLEAEWREASPVTGKFNISWPNAKAVVLAHSRDDELVNFVQTQKLSHQLWREKCPHRRDLVIAVEGKHDQIWQDGSELARAISITLQLVIDIA